MVDFGLLLIFFRINFSQKRPPYAYNLLLIKIGISFSFKIGAAKLIKIQGYCQKNNNCNKTLLRFSAVK